MKNLVTRTVTGILFIVVVVWCIINNPVSLWALSSVITGVALFEFYKIIFEGKLPAVQYAAHITAGIYVTTVLWLFAFNPLYAEWSVALSLSPYIIYVCLLFISGLYSRSQSPFADNAKVLAGHMYIAVPCGLLSYIAAYPGLSFIMPYAPYILLAFFILIWIYDTGAYVTGSTLGKHKLFVRISPKKSWEGVFGGMFFSLAASVGIYYWYGAMGYRVLSLGEWLGLALIVTIAATFGDLTESLLKRNYGVKDSGKILPGHGGMMDRFDSIFIAAPAAFIYITLIEIM